LLQFGNKLTRIENQLTKEKLGTFASRINKSNLPRISVKNGNTKLQLSA
jgi:hypothetical protein